MTHYAEKKVIYLNLFCLLNKIKFVCNILIFFKRYEMTKYQKYSQPPPYIMNQKTKVLLYFSALHCDEVKIYAMHCFAKQFTG